MTWILANRMKVWHTCIRWTSNPALTLFMYPRHLWPSSVAPFVISFLIGVYRQQRIEPHAMHILYHTPPRYINIYIYINIWVVLSAMICWSYRLFRIIFRYMWARRSCYRSSHRRSLCPRLTKILPWRSPWVISVKIYLRWPIPHGSKQQRQPCRLSVALMTRSNQVLVISSRNQPFRSCRKYIYIHESMPRDTCTLASNQTIYVTFALAYS